MDASQKIVKAWGIEIAILREQNRGFPKHKTVSILLVGVYSEYLSQRQNAQEVLVPPR